MARWGLFVFISILISACSSWSILTYEKDDLSGISQSGTSLAFLPPSPTGSRNVTSVLDETLKKSSCEPPLLKSASLIGAGTGAILIGGVLAPAIQYGVDTAALIIEERAKKIERANKKSYSGRIFFGSTSVTGERSTSVSRESMTTARCFFFARYSTGSSPDKPEPSLIAGFEINRYDRAWSLKPIFFDMKNAVAQTRSRNLVDGGEAKVSVSIALAARIISKDSRYGIHEVNAVSGPIFIYRGVPLKSDEDSYVFCSSKNPERCPKESDVFYFDEKSVVSLTMSVVETGSDAEIASESEAAREALADAVGTTLGDVGGVLQPGP